MAISKADSEKMRRLAQEGKQISDIVTDYFPKLDYSEVYIEVYSGGQRSARGIKRMITNRLDAIVQCTSKTERKAMAEELNNLVWDLYDNHKSNHEKLTKIRQALSE